MIQSVYEPEYIIFLGFLVSYACDARMYLKKISEYSGVSVIEVEG